MRSRNYSAVLGRFEMNDLIGISGGTTNLYEYGANSPSDRIDPTGLASIWIPSGAGTVWTPPGAGTIWTPSGAGTIWTPAGSGTVWTPPGTGTIWTPEGNVPVGREPEPAGNGALEVLGWVVTAHETYDAFTHTNPVTPQEAVSGLVTTGELLLANPPKTPAQLYHASWDVGIALGKGARAIPGVDSSVGYAEYYYLEKWRHFWYPDDWFLSDFPAGATYLRRGLCRDARPLCSGCGLQLGGACSSPRAFTIRRPFENSLVEIKVKRLQRQAPR
jgi:hypothetical protein